MNVEAWLREIGMGQYAEQFLSNEIDGEILLRLSSDDLKDIGVVALGHRKKLLDAIAALVTTSASPFGKPVPPASGPSEAERRQLTVMFVDLVGSTELSTRLDPEDMSELLRTYRNCCSEAIAKWDGYVINFMGDGVLAYFGWPRAHEDDAERSVRTGLELVAAVGQLNLEKGNTLAVRVGIATGQVVAGYLIDGGGAQERNAVGDTPNLAARLQSVAAPNTIVIGPTTRRLLGNLFEFRELGPLALKGFAEPVPAYEVVRAGKNESRFEALRAVRTPLVGRDEEIDLLLRRWQLAKAGEGQVVLLSGEAGIGKSRISATLLERLADEPYVRLRHFCSPHHTTSLLHPFVSQLERAAGFDPEDPPQSKLDKLEASLASSTRDLAEDAALFAELLSIPTEERYPALKLSPQQKKEKTLAALRGQLEALATRNTVLMIFEDAHWIDPTSLELMEGLVDRVEKFPVLVVITFRPEFQAPWVGLAHVTLQSLNKLNRRESAALIGRMTGGKPLPDEVAQQIIEHTDGVPLFIEELTKTVLEGTLLEEQADRYILTGPLPPLAIPTSLQASLMARLDRLAPLKDVAQIGAAIGREFSVELLAAVAGRGETDLQQALDQLVAAGLIFRRGSPPRETLLFKHALVQDAAYASMLRNRRQELHARIAKVLEESFPDTVETQPELLAHHYTQAGLNAKAVEYWHRAGERALLHSANREAERHFSQGIELVSLLPSSSDLSRREYRLYTGLGAALRVTKGYTAPETTQAFAKARELIGENSSIPEQMASLYTLWGGNWMGGRSEEAYLAAKQALDLLERTTDIQSQAMANRIIGWALYSKGNFIESTRYLKHTIDLCSASDGVTTDLRYAYTDSNIGAIAILGIDYWLLGYPHQSDSTMAKALTKSRELGHAASSSSVLALLSILAACRRDLQALCKWSAELLAFSTENGIQTFLDWGKFYQGAAQFWNGNPEMGIGTMHSAMTSLQNMDCGVWLPNFLSVLAEAQASIGETELALKSLDEACKLAASTQERFFEAEIHRTRGEVLLSHDCAGAEQSFEQALAVAREQQAKSWELRAAVSLARLWHSQGKRDKARDLLAPIYNWFTEGLDTPDLKAAKALLDELGRG